MYQLKVVSFLAVLAICSSAYAGDAGTTAPATDASPHCNAEGIAKFELKVSQDGKIEADLMASPAMCGPGAQVAIHHIPSMAIDNKQVDSSNALDVELAVESVGRDGGRFLVSLDTRRLDAAHSTQAAPGMATANLARRTWRGVVSLKPGEEMTLLKDGGQVATMRRVQ